MADDNTEKLIIDNSQAVAAMREVVELAGKLRAQLVAGYKNAPNPFEAYRGDFDAMRSAVKELNSFISAQKLAQKATAERFNLEQAGITRIAKETAERFNLEQAGITRIAKETAERFNLEQAGIVRVSKEIAEKNNLEQAGITRIAKEIAEKNNLEQAGIARLAKERADYNNLYLSGLTRTAAMEREQAAARAQPLNLLASRAGRIGDYALIGGGISAVYGTASEVLSLDKALANLQAITQTSSTGMEGLRSKIVAVAEGSRFMSSEVADAATTLGQAGLSASQIGDALKGVVALAQATGSDLKSSVDIMTTAFGAFGLRADETMNIANTFTAAINKSKLTMEQLSQGFQYSANYAAQAGVSFEELTTVLAAMANAGIRSGSTLGTGLRSLFKDLEKPSKDFRTALSVIHLSLKDIDVQKLGIIQVIKNLHDAGFGASEAMKTLETRSAAAFVAVAGQLDNIDNLRKGITGTNAALEAATTQMGSFSNTAKQFGSTFTAITATGINPFLRGLQSVLSTTTSVMSVLGEFKGTLTVISTVISGLVVGSITRYVASLITARAATAGLGALFTAMGGWVTVAATAIIALVSWLGRGTDKLDELAAATEEAKGKADSYKDTVNQVDQEIERLTAREDVLRQNKQLLSSESQRLGERFRSLGLDVTNLGADYDALMHKMQGVRDLALQLRGASLIALKNKLQAESNAELEAATNAAHPGLLTTVKRSVFGGYTGSYDAAGTAALKALSSQYPTIGAAIARMQQGGTLTANDIQLFTSASSQLGTINQSNLSGAAKTVVDDLTKALGDIQHHLARAAQKSSDVAEASEDFAANSAMQSKAFESLKQRQLSLLGALNNTEGLDPLNNLKNESILTKRKQQYGPQVHALLDSIEAFAKQNPANARAVGQSGLETDLTSAFQQGNIELADAQKADASLRRKAAQAAANAIGDQIKLLDEQLSQATSVADASAVGEKLKDLTTKQFQAKIAQGKDTPQGLAAAVDSVQEKVDARIKQITDQLNAATRRMASHDASILGREISELNRQADLLFKGVDDNTPSTQITEAIQKAREIAGMVLGKTLDQIGKQAIAGDLTPDQEADAAHTAINNYLDKLSEYGDRSKKLTIQFEGIDRNAAEAWVDVLKSLRDPQELTAGFNVWATTLKNTLVNVFKTAKDSFSDFLTSVESGTKKIGDAFRDMGRSILQSALKTINDRISQQFMQFLGNGINSLIGGGDAAGGGSSIFSSILGGGSTATGAASLTTAGVSLNSAAAALTSAAVALGGSGVTNGVSGAASAAGGSGSFASWLSSLFSSGAGGSYMGGLQRFSLGSEVTGPIKTRDSVKALLQPGEYVLRKSAVDMLGVKALDRLNTMGNTQVAKAAGKLQPNAPKPPAITNVWVVAPDQKPQMGPKDVVAAISSDILKNGVTKKLIKSVQAGM